ncbi:hypothetical protein GCM10009100_38540 [Thalassospira tepidiphila]
MILGNCATGCGHLGHWNDRLTGAAVQNIDIALFGWPDQCRNGFPIGAGDIKQGYMTLLTLFTYTNFLANMAV